jgi:predicted  nucleic acid-binding Zn-ribbon protein
LTASRIEMSERLRTTQKNYEREIANIDRQNANLQKRIEANNKRKQDVQTAKAIVDEQVSKLPPKSSAKPASTMPAKGA